MIKLEELRVFFDSFPKPIYQIELEKGFRIVDYYKFIESHLIILESNLENKRYTPYYDRLIKLYNILTR